MSCITLATVGHHTRPRSSTSSQSTTAIAAALESRTASLSLLWGNEQNDLFNCTLLNLLFLKAKYRQPSSGSFRCPSNLHHFPNSREREKIINDFLVVS